MLIGFAGIRTLFCHKGGMDVRTEIVEKLRAELTKAIETEAQAVYLLVEVRKLIEHSEHRERYLSVLFFCEWALHVKMGRQSAFLLLKEIDEALERSTSAVQMAELGPMVSVRWCQPDPPPFFQRSDGVSLIRPHFSSSLPAPQAGGG
jgi:hypothetical protein